MKYSMKEIINSLPKIKKQREPYIVRVYRSISYILTWPLINIGMSANMISFISIFIAMAGSFLIAVDKSIMRLAGTVVLNLWLVFDCIDGNIARTTKTSSYMGEFFDAVGGYAIFSFAPLGIGVAAYNTSKIFGEYNYLFIVLGALSSICGVYSRLIHQKYMNSENNARLGNNMEILSSEAGQYYMSKTKNFNYYRKKIDMSIGVAGIYFPLLILSCIFTRYDWFVIFYFFYFVLSFLAILMLYTIKASKFNKNVNGGYHNI